MASNFIPMLSSSPPPLDDCPDNDDDDDDFGTFASANIPFDSSFDSPVSGEKYKPLKTGANGVNNITLKNDLNTFCSYSDSQPPTTPNYKQNTNTTLSFSPQTQNKCKKNCSPVEVDVLPDQIDTHSSSTEDIPSKINSSASQNCVPDSVHAVNHDSENSCDSHEDSNWCKRNKLSSCSTEETVRFESEFPDSNNSNCDADNIKKSLFVPPCDVEYDKTGNIIHDKTIQSRDVVEECQKSLPAVNTSECVIQRSNDVQSTVDEDISSSIPQNNSISENIFSDFSMNHPQGDEFDDFHSANLVSSSVENCSDVERNSNDREDENTETFEADFADFQSSIDNQLEGTNIENFQPSEKGIHSEAAEFGDFGSFPTNDDCHQSDGDEFDDFQSCDKTISVSSSLKDDEHVDACSSQDNSKVPSSDEPVVADDDFDEEFDDFQACSDIAAPAEQGFANFETQPFEQKESEFADFESASFNSASSETFQSSVNPSMSIPNQEKNVDKLSAVTSTIFPLKEEESNAVDASYDPASEILEQCNKSRRLWEKLHEVEQTPGLRFQWGVSHSFQQLLRSVNVDYHSILRTSSVPIFASSLSLLEPVKGQANSANQESDNKIIQSPKDPIPPVEFDWNSSGLVNPLDLGQTASILMDLSFLSSSESVTSSSVGNNSFENELLKPSPVPACSDISNSNFILEELLSKNVCSIPNSKIAHRQSNLSEEAKNVLDQLPDLSFMRAKVLMFPISSKT